jgi:hydroxyacylglutathione hydrolase
MMTITQAIRISDHIYLVGSGEIGLSEEHDSHVYLVDAGKSRFLIDAGAGIHPQMLQANIARLGFAGDQITHLLLTHCHADHAGGACALQKEFGLKVGAGPLTAARVTEAADQQLALDVARREGVYPPAYTFLPPTVNEVYADRAQFMLGDCAIQVFETPGHSADSLCYQVNLPEGVALFCGDTVFANGLLPLLNTFDSELAAYRQSIARLAAIEFTILCPGHGLFVLSEANAIVRRIHEKLTRSIFVPPVITP